MLLKAVLQGRLQTNAQNTSYLHIRAACMGEKKKIWQQKVWLVIWFGKKKGKYFNVTFITHSCQLFLSIYDENSFPLLLFN